MKLASALLLSCALLGSCQTTPPKPGGGVVGPQPGGDCVININPSGAGYGPTFSLGHDFDGNPQIDENGDTLYVVQITSNADDITIGKHSGPKRETLTKGVVYDVVIKDLEGTTAEVYKQATPPTNFKISIEPHGANYKSEGFVVMVRDEPILSTDYVAVVVTKDGKGIQFHVNE